MVTEIHYLDSTDTEQVVETPIEYLNKARRTVDRDHRQPILTRIVLAAYKAKWHNNLTKVIQFICIVGLMMVTAVCGYSQVDMIAVQKSIDSIPDGTSTIMIDSMMFKDACNWLLDNSFEISRKDADLQTVETKWSKVFGGSDLYLKLAVRVKEDSTLILTGFYRTINNYSSTDVSPTQISKIAPHKKRATGMDKYNAMLFRLLWAAGNDMGKGHKITYQ